MYPIRIHTQAGAGLFDTLMKKYKRAERNGSRQQFREDCIKAWKDQISQIEFFLNDKSMSREYKLNEDDHEGFKIFNEQSDACAILKYFGEKSV